MRACQLTLIAAMVAASLGTPAPAAELMPAAQQTALVQKYCAVCHTDAVKNGGLSLEHFNAAQAPPSLTAMLLSKLTGGVLLKTAAEATSNLSAAALVDAKMKSGAMSAAGIPIPDKATIDALIHAFAVESARAADWTVERTGSQTLTASVLREAFAGRNPGEAEAYRVIASCNAETRQGALQLAWSPVARTGTLAASVDGSAPMQYRVEGSEAMGNGSGLVLHGLAALPLADLPFPAESLTITDLFPGDIVTFSFANLPPDARQSLNACFPGPG